MEKITLYRYNRSGGGVTVSTEKPETEYTELLRLVADEGMALTDGNTVTTCIDTEDVTVWEEVEMPSGMFIPTDPDEATDADYQSALREMGVSL